MYTSVSPAVDVTGMPETKLNWHLPTVSAKFQQTGCKQHGASKLAMSQYKIPLSTDISSFQAGDTVTANMGARLSSFSLRDSIGMPPPSEGRGVTVASAKFDILTWILTW